ncbi:MAG: hypothetical protein J7M14_06030 [Planctomycetes bacterium]|nr:hypothetical protein [Planctomycetota bacterium]
MKVFLAGIMQGSLAEAKIHAQDWREPIKRVLSSQLGGAEIYCHYSRHPNSITYAIDDIRQTLAEGIDQARQCDLLIAYVPRASMGTAVEMYEAHRAGAAVVSISPMAPNWVLRAYSDHILNDLAAFQAWADSGALTELVRIRNSR